jgi:hypothetical protein
MNASEARSEAKKVYDLCNNTEYNDIKTKIKSVVAKGQFKLVLNVAPSQIVKDKLISEGYKVESFYDQRDQFSDHWVEW